MAFAKKRVNGMPRVQPPFGGVFVAGAYYGPRSKPIVLNARL